MLHTAHRHHHECVCVCVCVCVKQHTDDNDHWLRKFHLIVFFFLISRSFGSELISKLVIAIDAILLLRHCTLFTLYTSEMSNRTHTMHTHTLAQTRAMPLLGTARSLFDEMDAMQTSTRYSNRHRVRDKLNKTILKFHFTLWSPSYVTFQPKQRSLANHGQRALATRRKNPCWLGC